MQAGGVNFAVVAEAVVGLKFLHGGDGVRVPFAVGIALVVAAAGQGGLNFRDAFGSGGFLRGFAFGCVMLLARFLFLGRCAGACWCC